MFYTRNEVKHSMAIQSCLLTECSYFVLNDFQIEIYADLKNELFVQGYLFSQLKTLKVFVIQQTVCSYILVHYLSF